MPVRKNRSPQWMALAAGLVFGLYAVGAAARFVSSTTASDQDIVFTSAAGVRGVFDFNIEGKASDVHGEETGSDLVLRAPVAKLDTDNKARDQHLYSTLKGSEYSDIVLKLPKSSLPKLADNAKQEGSITGQFTLAGKTKSVPIKYRVNRTGSDYHVQAKFEVKLPDFDIKPPCKGPVCVSDKVSVQVRRFKFHDK